MGMSSSTRWRGFSSLRSSPARSSPVPGSRSAKRRSSGSGRPRKSGRGAIESKGTCPPDRTDSGWTTIEVVIALAVTVLVGAVAVSAVSGELRALGAARDGFAAASAALRVDDALRESIGSIRIPYWDRSARPQIASGSLVCPFFGGRRDASLRVTASEGTLAIVTGDYQRVFAGVDRMSARMLAGTDGSIKGVSVTFWIDGIEYRTSQVFASAAIGERP